MVRQDGGQPQRRLNRLVPSIGSGTFDARCRRPHRLSAATEAFVVFSSAEGIWLRLKRLNLALIGAGQMGSNHARVIAESDQAEIGVVIDTDLDRAERLAARYGGQASSSLGAAANMDAAIVASSTEAHPPIATALIDAQVPLLIEKPLAIDLSDVEMIVKASERQHVPLLCGFVERFNPAVGTGLALLDEPPLHIVTTRHSPPAPRINTSVVIDLLIHDVDLVVRAAGGLTPTTISSASFCPNGQAWPEITDCLLQFASGTIGGLSANRMGQRKVRQMTMLSTTQLVEVDLLRQDVTVYRNVGQELIDQGVLAYRSDTIVDIPYVRHAGEPLALQLKHFVGLVLGDVDPDAERSSLLTPHIVAAEIERQVGADRGDAR
jgi:predicted dehydrogenase